MNRTVRIRSRTLRSLFLFGIVSLSALVRAQAQTTPAIEFSSAIYFVDEDAGPVTINVTRSGNTAAPVSIQYRTGKGLATPDIDFTPRSGTLSFGAGETNQTFSISILDDTLAEGSETVELVLTNALGGAVLGQQSTARLYIQDNENRGTLLDTTFSGAIQPTDAVTAMALQSDGRIVAAGSFARAGAANPDRLIRLQKDGRLDTPFNGAGPNGNVFGVAVQSDGKIIIGGDFTRIGSTARTRIARLNPDGSLDLSFFTGSGVNGASSPGVFKTILQPDGKILIAGSFDSVNGVTRKSLARLDVNGSLDTTFDPGAGITSSDTNFLGAWVSGVGLQRDGKIVIGGQFTSVDGVPRLNVARLNTNGLVDLSFNPGAAGTLASIEAIAIQPDGKILIGGDFTNVNSVARNGIARLNPDGTVDASFDPGSGIQDIDAQGNTLFGLVTSILVQTDGKILFGGAFLTYDEINRHGVGRVNADGSLDGTFGPYFGTTYHNEFGYEEIGGVSSMVLQPDGKVLIGARFDSPNGTSTNRITRLLSANVRASSFEFSTPATVVGESKGPVEVTVIRRGDSDQAYTVEYVSDPGSATAGVDYTPQSGTLRFAPLEVEKTITIPVFDDGLIETNKTFGLSLRAPSQGASISDPTNHLVRIIDSKRPGNVDLEFAEVNIPFLPDPLRYPPVAAISLQENGKILVSGQFLSVNNTNRSGLVRLNTDGTIDSSFDPQPPRGSLLFNFYEMGLQPDGHIIGGFIGLNRLATNGALDGRFLPDVGYVNALAVDEDGSFIVFDEHPDPLTDIAIDEIARFLPDGFFDTDFEPAVLNDWANSVLIQSDEKILIAGYFTEVNGKTQNRIARLNSDGTLDTLFKIGSGVEGTTNSTVFALALQPDGKILVAGDFSGVNNVSRNNLARLNGDGSLDLSFDTGVGPNGYVESVAVQPDGKILIGGSFIEVNGVPRVGFARLNSDGTVDMTYNTDLGFPDTVLVSSIVLQPDGKILLGGLFNRVNGMPREGIARILGDQSLLRLTVEPPKPNGPVRLNLTTQPGRQYRIDASGDLRAWSPLSTNIANSATLQFEDPNRTGLPARFYRAFLLPP